MLTTYIRERNDNMKTKSELSYKTIEIRYKHINKAFVKLFLGMVAILLFAGCEPKDIFEEEHTNIPPTGQKIVRVEPDDGVTRVNSLPKAIKENGDAVYELERGGVYYLEGKNVISHNVTIRAAYGTQSLPTIQPVSDAQGALNSDMLRFEGNVTFENVYVNGKDAASNNIMQRLFRLDKKNLSLRFKGCFVENCRNFCIRTDNSGSKIYIDNSTFRNFALTSDPANGRLFDSRGNAPDTISITNSTIYNLTGHIIHFDEAVANYVEVKNNTIYNVGYHFRINYAMKAYIENNIFANVGWKAGYKADPPPAFWDLKELPKSKSYDPKDIKIYIRNNNVYTDQAIKALYTKYPGNYERIPLNSVAETMIADGRLVYEKNISEVLTFDGAPPLPMAYIDKFFEVLNTGMSPWADLPFYVDENGADGFTNNETFTFRYPSSAVSATASTTNGPLGAPMWNQ